MELAIRCTYPACPCSCFLPSESQARVCQGCKHGWVAHVLDKLTSGCGLSGAYGLPQMCLNVVEPVSASAVFDVASLVLYGSQAVPIRLKILLDRLLGALAASTAAASAASLGATTTCDDPKAGDGGSSSSPSVTATAAAEAAVVTLRVLHDLGWSYEDYIRGYVLQDLHGKSLDKWTVMHRDEECIALQQFSRFAETRTLAQEMLLQEARSTEELCPRQKKTESDIRKFIERSNLAIAQSYGLTPERGAMPPQAAPGASAAATSRPAVTDPSLIVGIEFLQAAHRLASRPAAAGAATNATIVPTSSRGALAGSSGREWTGDQSGDRVHDASSGRSGEPPLPPPRTCSGGGSDASGPAGSSAHALGPFSAPTNVQASGDCPSAQSVSASSPLSNRSSAASENRLDGGEDGRGAKEWAAEQQQLRQQQQQRGGGVADASGSGAARDDFGESGHFAGRSGAGGRVNGVAASLRPLAAAVASWSGCGSGGGGTRQSARSRRSSSSSWSMPGAALAALGGSGDKKRVLCTECNKTFCDKGALKIHYSAVHLREMHRCTIAGCTMTFSSRRSRNRHSANPNPKLHTGAPASAKDDDYESDEAASGSDDLHSSAHTDDCFGGGPLLLVDDGDSHSPLVVQVKMEDGLTSATTTVAAAAAYDCGAAAGRREQRSVGKSQSSLPVELASAAALQPTLSKWDGPLHGSSKRKRLVPTRHVAAASRSNAMGDEDDDDYDDDGDDDDDDRLVRSRRERDGETAADSTNASDDAAATAGEASRPSEPLSNGRGEHEPAPGGSPAAGVSDSASKPSYGYGQVAVTSQLQLSFPGGSPRRGFGSGDAVACGGGGSIAVESVGSPDGSAVDKSASPSAFASATKNPRQCPSCLKVFQNHFSAKIHYESVHLRLMHQCTIPGCTASFPSKRSRDRHSNNANLHRRQSETAPVAEGANGSGSSSAEVVKCSAADFSENSSDGEYSTGGVPEGSGGRRTAGSNPQLPRRATTAGADGTKATVGC